ncbi:hypothetical protein JYU34_015364, partial [Plutella xylostella]
HVSKNLLRLAEFRFRKVSGCGLFPVEPRSMLRLLGLVATYTVILLQFALLSKNLLRLAQFRFRKVSGCGLFPVEPRSMLRLLGLVATYTIILLQFALL